MNSHESLRFRLAIHRLRREVVIYGRAAEHLLINPMRENSMASAYQTPWPLLHQPCALATTDLARPLPKCSIGVCAPVPELMATTALFFDDFIRFSTAIDWRANFIRRKIDVIEAIAGARFALAVAVSWGHLKCAFARLLLAA